MNYLAYHFKVNPPQPGSDILMAIIADLGFESFVGEPDGFTAYIQEQEQDNLAFDDVKFDDFTFEYSIEKIEEKNWNEVWESSFEPVLVDDLLAIRAAFHQQIPTVKHEIIITPKMSFGTGHHQTTRLMCREIFNINIEGKRVLDMGCGTGILAILACKLGAGEILGIDIDPWSVENAIENCVANNCSNIMIRLGDIGDIKNEGAFDVILANINKNILKTQMPAYAEKLVKGGPLLLSGFFITDVEELKDFALEYGLEYQFHTYEQEWAMMRLIKR
jgi:ribosomal protein L11 methyltransferase